MTTLILLGIERFARFNCGIQVEARIFLKLFSISGVIKTVAMMARKKTKLI